MRRLRSELAIALACAACSSSAGDARPQLVVVIDTDLPVPPDPAANALPTVSPLVDAARVEIVHAGTSDLACADVSECQRDFALDEGTLRRHEISFGLVGSGSAIDVRVRLFGHRRVDAYGQPIVGGTDEVRARAVFPASGVQTETIVVPGDAWGRSGTDAATIEGVLGAPPESVVGQWSGARPAPCTLAPTTGTGLHDEERCVPGGALLRGAVDTSSTSSTYGGELTEPRLVLVSPMLMDAFEVTVARYESITLPASVAPPLTYATDDTARPWRASCTLGANGSDALPLNCVTPDTAEAICEALGKRLPTHSELELAGTGPGGGLFPWGYQAAEYVSATSPSGFDYCCGGVVFARQSPVGAISGVTFDECAATNAPPASGAFPTGPEAVDAVVSRSLSGPCAGVRDVSKDGVVGLGGNVSEWTADFFSRVDQACWSTTTPVRDPKCVPPLAPTAYRIYALGSWISPPLNQGFVVSESEGADRPAVAETGVGLRCVRSGVAAP